MSIELYSIKASAILKQIEKARIDFCTTVPDFIQLSVHVELERGVPGCRYVRCATEEQATTCAAGLIIGGKRPLTIVQNQGFLACINAIRAAGLDACLPIVFMIGQFGREDENLGKDSRLSERRVVNLLEPMLELLDMDILRLETPGDEVGIPDFYERARANMKPAAIVVGARTAWDA